MLKKLFVIFSFFLAAFIGFGASAYFFSANIFSFNSEVDSFEDFIKEISFEEEDKKVTKKDASIILKPNFEEKSYYQNIEEAVSVDERKDVDSLKGFLIVAQDQYFKVIELTAFLKKIQKSLNLEDENLKAKEITLIFFEEMDDFESEKKMAISKAAIQTDFGVLQPDLELIESLEQNFSDLVLFDDKNIFQNSTFAPQIKNLLEEVRVVNFAVSKDISEEEMDLVLNKLEQYFRQNSGKFISVTTTNRRKAADSNLDQFIAENFLSTIKTLSYSELNQYQVYSQTALKAFFKVLQKQEAYLENENPFAFGYKESTSYFFQKGKKTANKEISIFAVGDMMLGRHVRIQMENNGLDYIFEGVGEAFGGNFFGADIIHGNLEGPIIGEGKKGGTSMNFAFNIDTAPLLKKWGFTMLSISNNHATDAGWEGRDSTIAELQKNDLAWCGHPSQPDPLSVYSKEIDGQKIAFVCLHNVTYFLDNQKASELIRDLKKENDFVVVSIHWGVEYVHTAPFESEVKPAHMFIDAGADFIIGHHPHVVQNFELYKDKFIFYSLGNFVFDQYWSSYTQEELAIGVQLKKVNGETKADVHLFPMRSIAAQSRFMTEIEKKEWIERFIGYGDYSQEMMKLIREGVVRNY